MNVLSMLAVDSEFAVVLSLATIVAVLGSVAGFWSTQRGWLEKVSSAFVAFIASFVAAVLAFVYLIPSFLELVG